MWLTYKGRYDTSSLQWAQAENVIPGEGTKKIQQTTQDVIYNKDLPRDTISCTAIHEEMSFFFPESEHMFCETPVEASM